MIKLFLYSAPENGFSWLGKFFFVLLLTEQEENFTVYAMHKPFSGA